MKKNKSSFSSLKIATSMITGLACIGERATGKHHAQRRRLRFRSSSAVMSIVAVCIVLLMTVPFIYYDVSNRSFSYFGGEAKEKFNHQHSYRTTNFPPSTSKDELLDKHSESSTSLLTPLQRETADTDRKITGSTLDVAAPFIHIVNTRFQQHSRNLTAIGAARLELFETFCLPSMIHQTIQPQTVDQTDPPSEKPYRFIWIIKTDPNLNLELRSKMVQLLQPFPNFFLVGTNNNYPWRDGKAGNDILYGNATVGVSPNEKPNIYTGDVSLLHFAHEHRGDKIVLETRLDADDGLPGPYLDYVQTSAMERLSSGTSMEQAEDHDGKQYSESVKRARWYFWCMPNSANWYPTVSVEGFNPKSTLTKREEPGVLIWEKNNICLTPGLTIGLSVGARQSQVPSYSHHKLLWQLDNHRSNPKNFCGIEQSNLPCIQVLDMVLALRARTPTSAGMSNAVIKERVKHSSSFQWRAMMKKFGVDRQRAVRTNRYIMENIEAILKDNLAGQCTKGHSCKNSSRVILTKMIKRASESKEAILKEPE